ncbi:hypothetical protein HCN56_23205 [Streptomyces lonarensis]|uniref:Uncharacterized protein n=3 Tax=Streptomyces lonarensis TaxID=700599 RepID=A0A7X6I152_9ACTN|nr:hypothetical protein [Streptomyces lonarensis]
MEHRLEAYVPAPDRRYGYFAMPVLAGGRLVARVDPARDGEVLVARHVTLEGGGERERIAAQVADALREAAGWVGCVELRVERVTPEEARPALVAAVAGVG